MSYKQLTQEQRYHIYGLLKAGKSQKDIAKEIKVSKSTVSRELQRNTGQKGYRPKQAQELSERRKKSAKKHVKFTAEIKRFVESRLERDWSPEQISGYMKKEGQVSISHERIYQHILEDKRSGGILYKHLRRSNRKRKKRYGSIDHRGQIKNRRSIDSRPKIVEQKSRIGDFEIDTVIGKNYKQALVTIVDRKSRMTFIAKVIRKEAKLVAKATVDLLKPYKAKTHTITADNGKEFAWHEHVAKELDLDFYFAHPYSSWERGLNENTNGLIRQYLPKKTDFTKVTNFDINRIEKRLNNRPRKSLGFKTPAEIFTQSL